MAVLSFHLKNFPAIEMLKDTYLSVTAAFYAKDSKSSENGLTSITSFILFRMCETALDSCSPGFLCKRKTYRQQLSLLSLPQRLPKMRRRSGHFMQEVVAYGDRLTGVFREDIPTHLEFIVGNFQVTICLVPCCHSKLLV